MTQIMNETQAIFKIVMRNLCLDKWFDLEPEAQVQMLEEVAGLLGSHIVCCEDKQQLCKALQRLDSFVDDLQKQRINQILRQCF